MALELPSEPSTRAIGDESDGNHSNDVFGDGIASEYRVKNAAILLFIGNSEADAEFVGAYPMGHNVAMDQPDGDNITTSFKNTIKVLNPPTLTGKNLYGLAIVNYGDSYFKIEDDPENDDYGDMQIKTFTYEVTETTNSETGKITQSKNIVGEGFKSLIRYKDKDETTNPTKFSELRKYVTDSQFIRSTGEIFMTNAPLSNEKGGSGATLSAANTIQTLALLTGGFYEKEEDAVNKPAGCIFVERAVAKITCSAFPATVELQHKTVALGGTGSPIGTLSKQTLKVQNVWWMVDNEEPVSYFVRYAEKDATKFPFWGYSYTGKDNLRFIGSAGMDNLKYDGDDVHDPTKSKTLYRTYWCKDPSYDSPKYFEDQANATGAFPTSSLLGGYGAGTTFTLNNKILYPRENTFSVNYQNYRNTTRVVFKVQYASNDGTPLQLYAIRGQLSSFLLLKDAENYLKSYILESQALNQIVRKYMKGTQCDYNADSFIFDIQEAKADDVNADAGIELGDLIMKSVSFKSDFVTTNFKTDLSDEDKATVTGLADDANDAYHIAKFENNICYYVTYLRHFGDTYCKLPADWKGENVESVYGTGDTASKNYLGRYGLVRNNWYDLNVSLIGNLGKAKVPDGFVKTSDDNKKDEWYLSARIHVLSWAKRSQNVEF